MPDPLSINLAHLKASETVAISAETKRRKAAGEDVVRPERRRARFRHAGADPPGGHRRDPEGLHPLSAQHRPVRAAHGDRADPVAHVGWPGGQSRPHGGELGLEAVAVQRLLHPLRPGTARAHPGTGVGVLSPDRAPGARRAGPGARRHRVGPQGERARPRRRLQQVGEGPHPLLALQPDGRGLHARRAQGHRRVGPQAPGLDHLRRDLPPHQLRARAGGVDARPARRAARAHRAHLRRVQGLRDDRLAHRLGAGAAAHRQGDGGPAVAHHDRRQSSGAVGRGHRLQR